MNNNNSSINHNSHQSGSSVLHLGLLLATTATSTTAATRAILPNVTDCHGRQRPARLDLGSVGNVNRFFDVSRLGASLDLSETFPTDSNCQRYFKIVKSFDLFSSPLAWISEQLDVFNLTSQWPIFLIAIVILDVLLSCWRCFLLSQNSQFADDEMMPNQRSRRDSLKKKLREEKNCWERRKSLLPFLTFPGQMEDAAPFSWIFERNSLQSFGRLTSTKCDLISESQPSSAESHHGRSLCSDTSAVEINLAVKTRHEAKSYLLPSTRCSGELRDSSPIRTCDKSDVLCLDEVQESSNISDYLFLGRKPRGSTPARILILDVLDSTQCFKVATFGVVLLIGQLLDSFRQMAASQEAHRHHGSVSFTTAEDCGVSLSNLPFFFSQSDFQHLKCLLSMVRHDGLLWLFIDGNFYNLEIIQF